MTVPSLRCCSRTAVAALAAVAMFGCRGEGPPSDHAARLARAAALGLPTDLRPDWGPTGPRGIACPTWMRAASDSTVRLALAAQSAHAEFVGSGNRTRVRRWAEGEYVVTPAGRYRAAPDGTLRVDCSRGAAIAPPGA